MRLLTQKGVQGTPMSAIAAAAGTGMGTIYNYFATKEALINAVYLYVKRAAVQQLNQRMDHTLPLKTRFFQYYAAFIEFYQKYPESFAFMEQFHASPIITDKTRQEGKSDIIPVLALVEQGQRDGIIKNMDMEHLLQFLAGSMNTYVRWVGSRGVKEVEQDLNQHLRMVWDAIKE